MAIFGWLFKLGIIFKREHSLARAMCLRVCYNLYMKEIGEKQARLLERIKKRMEEVHLSQAELGKALGMDQYQVSRLLKGTPTLTIDELYIIAKKLDTTVEYLLLIRHTSLRELREEDRKILLSLEKADSSTKDVVKRLLGISM